MAAHPIVNKGSSPNEEFFRILERSKEYKRMESLVKKALIDQWRDLIYSGVINTIFKKYKTFFSGSKRKPAKIRKSFVKKDEVISEEELREAEQETLQGDRFIIGEEALLLAPFLLFLKQEVDKEIRSAGYYYNFKSELKDYLRITANKAGQTIIDQIPTPTDITFRLSNKALKAKIKERVDELVTQLDITTKKTLVNQLALGVKTGETKTQLVKRLQKKGLGLSEIRSGRIVATETEALAEFIRFETAKLNGTKSKIWITSSDERVCPICRPLNGEELLINQNFDAEGVEVKYPPAHVMCRCTVDYSVADDLASNFIKSNFIDEIDVLYRKSKSGNLYKPLKEGRAGIVNPNAVWAGGESLVGKDRDIARIFEEIRDSRPIAREKLIEEAGDKLTLEGIVQLRSLLGLSPNVKSNK